MYSNYVFKLGLVSFSNWTV